MGTRCSSRPVRARGARSPTRAYETVGARIASPDDVWERSRARPQGQGAAAEEYGLLRQGLILFTYLHLAADERSRGRSSTAARTCIAYETVQTEDGKLPLLAPMSEVAGRLATQMGSGRSRSLRAAAGSCSAGFPAWRRRASSCSAEASSATTPRSSPSACRPTSGCSTVGRRACGTLEMMLDGRDTLAMSSRLQIEEALLGRSRRRRRADPRGARAEARHPRHARLDEARRGRSSTSRSTRAAASRPRIRRPTPTLSTRSTASFTTAWRTCPAPCRSRRRSRSRT